MVAYEDKFYNCYVTGHFYSRYFRLYKPVPCNSIAYCCSNIN